MTSTSLAMKFSPFGVCLHLQLRPALRDSLFEVGGEAGVVVLQYLLWAPCVVVNADIVNQA